MSVAVHDPPSAGGVDPGTGSPGAEGSDLVAEARRRRRRVVVSTVIVCVILSVDVGLVPAGVATVPSP